MTIQQALKESDRLRNEVADLQGAIKILEDLSSVIDTSTDPYFLWVLKLAALYRDTGETHKSIELYKKGLAKAEEHNKNVFAADILHSLAFILLQNTKYAEAMNAIEKAKLLIAEQTGNFATETRANIYAVMGNLHFVRNNFDHALEAYKASLIEAKKSNFYQRAITVTGDIANVYIAQRELDLAIDILTNTIASAQKSYKIAVPQLLLRQGKIYLIMKDLIKAEESFNKALKTAEKENWIRDMAEANELLGDLFLELNNKKSALKHYNESCNIFNTIYLPKRAAIIRKKINSHLDKNSV